MGDLGRRGGGGGWRCIPNHLDAHGLRSPTPVALAGLGTLLLLQVRRFDFMCVSIVTKPVVSHPMFHIVQTLDPLDLDAPYICLDICHSKFKYRPSRRLLPELAYTSHTRRGGGGYDISDCLV